MGSSNGRWGNHRNHNVIEDTYSANSDAFSITIGSRCSAITPRVVSYTLVVTLVHGLSCIEK